MNVTVQIERRGNGPTRPEWVCPSCHAGARHAEVRANLMVCPSCGHHLRIGAHERIRQLTDEGTFRELWGRVATRDPLGFVDLEAYPERVREAQAKTGLSEAIITGSATIEGNAGKPIYQMSKWWARRRSSVFRSLLLSASMKAPEDTSQAAKAVWDVYYANHQKARSFRKLRVLDPFMGGGTTLVEGARLGMQMTGVDLNPVAWFVTKNELAGSDPATSHFLQHEAGRVVGYAQSNARHATAQLLVHPERRRQGLGGQLLHDVAERPDRDAGDVVHHHLAVPAHAQGRCFRHAGPIDAVGRGPH